MAALPLPAQTGTGSLLGIPADAPVLCARLGPDQAVQVGETVTVSFDPARLLMLEERPGR